MKRGIVMSIHKNHAVVMTRDGQFLKAPLQGSPQLGQELLFDEEVVTLHERRRRFSRLSLTRYVGAAAAVMLLLTAYLVYSATQAKAVVAYLTMDINPSIEIGIDERERVRELRAVNIAGSRLIEGIAYKGRELESVATVILERASSAHYLDAPHKDILIASIWMNSSNEQIAEFERMLAQSLDGELRSWLDAHDKPSDSVTITTLFLPAELKNEADSLGISAGKMALYLMAKDEGYPLELESLKKQSIDKATETIGGVGQIVGDAENPSTKAKLQRLLKQEQRQQAAPVQPSATSPSPQGQPATDKPSTKPTSNPTVKPTEKSATVKPTAKPTPKPTKQPSGKPNPAVKPGQGSQGGKGGWSDWEDWEEWKDWLDKWGDKWSKADLEKLRKEWEKSGKNWREQWKKWEEEQASWGASRKGNASWSWNDDKDRKGDDNKDRDKNAGNDKNGGRDRNNDRNNGKDRSDDRDDDRGRGRDGGKEDERRDNDQRGRNDRD